MDDTTKRIIERISVSYPTPTRIPTGQVCSVFYDCFQLTPSELARLAADAVGHLDHDTFEMVVGLAYSGILYASAVAGGKRVGILQKDGQIFGPDMRGLRIIVADDVVYRGGRLREATAKIEALGATVVGYACIVDRSGGTAGQQISLGPGRNPLPLWSAFQTDME
jgi:orotate phosphoribosyltransferase